MSDDDLWQQDMFEDREPKWKIIKNTNGVTTTVPTDPNWKPSEATDKPPWEE